MAKTKILDAIYKYASKNALNYSGTANPKSVFGKVVRDYPEAKKDVAETMKEIAKVCKEISKLSLEEIEKLSSKYTYEVKKKVIDFSLPEAQEGKVVMRFAPYPSGPLHIGHTRAAIANDELVKKYEGKLILALDDTAGSKEKKPLAEAYEMIVEDLKWLGVETHEIVYKSDRMHLFYKYAEEFLKNGWAYVCTCSVDELRKRRTKRIACKHRKYTPKKNLELWEKMVSGVFKQGEASVRLKTDMKHRDPAFRDRVLLRISELDHPRVGKGYYVWPMLEFSWAIDDHLLGMTHILRGKDLIMENNMQRFMWNLLKWPEPVIVNHGLMRFEGPKFSKSGAKKMIESGKYFGWEDPRTWTLRSLRARGIQPEAIRNFTKSFGLSETDIKVPIENLYRENRVLIDPKSNRYFFISDPVEFKVSGFKETSAKILKHPDFLKKGHRLLKVSNTIYLDAHDVTKKQFRLKGLGNFKIEGGSLGFIDDSTKTAREKKLQIVHWLPNGLLATVVMPDGKILKGLVEEHILKEKEGATVQFERFGFCRLRDRDKLIFYFGHK